MADNPDAVSVTGEPRDLCLHYIHTLRKVRIKHLQARQQQSSTGEHRWIPRVDRSVGCSTSAVPAMQTRLAGPIPHTQGGLAIG